MRNKPSYALTSVDNALRLVQLLRDQGRLRVTDAAAELDVAPSTAHRLLGMLVYRGFAIQDDGRATFPGRPWAPPRRSWTGPGSCATPRCLTWNCWPTGPARRPT